MVKINIGALTPEESVELVKEIINVALTDEQLFTTLDECLSEEQKQELVERFGGEIPC